jgi:hypothetical protein
MKKLSKIQFILLGYFILIVVALLFSFTYEMDFYGDKPEKYGATHTIFNIIFIGCWIVLLGSLISEQSGSKFYNYFYFEDDKKTNKSTDNSDSMNYNDNFLSLGKKILLWIGIIIFAFFLYGKIKVISRGLVFVYNNSKLYHNTYQQKVQEKVGFYDKLWKTYLQKEKITNINKETFLVVTKMIMENRKDGQSVTWKWLQENQQIPYNEFVKFYEDLSVFVTEQRDGYFKIEKDCQSIANWNNTLLDTFPNNLYNKILNCEKINFEYGLISDSTLNVFKTKKENLK